MNEHDDAAERFARRHFEALQQAGLKSWTFEEFRRFCAPQLQRAVATPPVEAAGARADELADLLSEELQSHYGAPLGPTSRNRVIRAAKQSLIACNRRRLRLVQPPLGTLVRNDPE